MAKTKGTKDLTSLLDLPQVDHDTSSAEAESDGPILDLSSLPDLTADADSPAFNESDFKSSGPPGEATSPGFLGAEDPLPTGDEPPSGELPADFRTSVDSEHFGSFDTDAVSANDASPDDVLSSLPPVDPDVEAIAAGRAQARDSMDDLPMQPVLPNEEEAKQEATGMNAVKSYVENLAPENSTPPTASNPYSLLIEGSLKQHEKERLLQILQQEKMGIREVEIEAQLAAGRILIPRISEYAGVMLVQALRNSRAKMRLGPSDRIFKRSDAPAEVAASQGPVQFVDDRDHRVFEMPVTTDQTFADARSLRVIDTLHGSLFVQASVVAQSRSAAFEECIEKLKTQMKLQAFFRGANGIVAFKTELHPNPEHSHYTVLAQGVAVKTS